MVAGRASSGGFRCSISGSLTKPFRFMGWRHRPPALRLAPSLPGPQPRPTPQGNPPHPPGKLPPFWSLSPPQQPFEATPGSYRYWGPHRTPHQLSWSHRTPTISLGHTGPPKTSQGHTGPPKTSQGHTGPPKLSGSHGPPKLSGSHRTPNQHWESHRAPTFLSKKEKKKFLSETNSPII
ncbi:hypothetical protein Fcan01_28598 [Folsomia candida]|uniref:Uncharacterized protein n=1 Tax=Folsomia candida TaxID=158441 RepID=A0A226CVV0_FOLCA|nr:hypothetical protein Fcan01_28598 [Folsomia candida]